MPTNKDLKRLVRARMEKTGESYTAARAHLLSPELPLPADYPKVAGMSDDAVRNATGHDWREWTRRLDAEDASAWPHPKIAKWLAETHGLTGWWSQSVTVAYERFRGLRDVGQRRGGGYDMNKSKTLGVAPERAKAAFTDPELRARWLPDLALEPVTTRSEKSLRFRMPDGATLAAWFEPKAEDRTAVSVQIEGFGSRELVDEARGRWGERLEALKEVLGSMGAPP